MSHHLAGKSRRRIAMAHLLFGAVVVVSAVVLMGWPRVWSAIAAVAGIHIGVAVAVHVTLALVAGGVVVAALRSHARLRAGVPGSPGITLHSPRFTEAVGDILSALPGVPRNMLQSSSPSATVFCLW
jgi:hypothetical protein